MEALLISTSITARRATSSFGGRFVDPREEEILRMKAGLLDEILACRNPGQILKVIREAEIAVSAILGGPPR